MDKKLQKAPNKAIIFRPRKQFRILIGQENMDLIRKDLFAYNHHLFRVFSAVPRVDNNAPPLYPHTYVDPRRLRADAERLRQVDAENKKLLGKINMINRSPAKVDCWNTYKKGPTSRRAAANKELTRRMAENRRILREIEAAQSIYKKSDLLKRYKKTARDFDERCHLRKVLHLKQPIDVVLAQRPSLTCDLRTDLVLPRRKVFLDFSVKDGVRLGQVVVELYYEHAPRMVKNFLAHCDESSEYNYKNCRIHYAEKNRFFALGDVTHNNGRGGHSIFWRDIKLSANDLKANRQGLLFAMPVSRIEKFDAGLTIRERIKRKPPELVYNSQFAVTIATCRNAKWPIFGKIVRGNSVLEKINDMLRRVGSPLVTIVVSRCGCVPFTREEERTFENVKREMKKRGVDLGSSDEEEEEEEEDAK